MFGIWDLADRYNQHIGVTITSLALNCSLPVTVHLLYDENLHTDSHEYRENQGKYHQLEDMFGVEICYHHIEVPEFVLTHPGTKQWTPAAYLRLFAPDLLSGLDWVLYLDGDIVVTCDMAEIWNQEWWMENFAVGACIDNNIYHRDYYQKLGLNLNTYVNSGVLLLNLKMIREKYTLAEASKKLLSEHPEFPFPDQDIVNLVFAGDIHYLHEKYNNCILFYPENEYDDCCIHYASEKPWRNIDHPASWEYWRYLALSPWGNSHEKYMHSIKLLTFRAPLDERVLTGRIISLRKFLCNLIRRGLNEARGVKKLRW